MATQPDNLKIGSRLPQTGKVLPFARHVPPAPDANLTALLERIDEAHAALRAEAIQSMQPSRYETWAMLIIVICLAIYAVAR